MNNWDDLKFFLSLSRKGSLKAAAKDLKTDQATVGRRIYALEWKLKTKLFEKRSDGYFLTLAGERIKATAEGIESSFESIDRKITGQDEKMEGVVRIAMPGALANHLVIPNIKKLTDQFPKIEIQFLTGSEVVNLAKREADMAFRLVRPSQGNLIVRKVGDFGIGLYGTKSTLKRYGKITKLEDLKEIPFVGIYDQAKSKTELSLLKKIKKHIGPQVLTSSAWSSVFSALSQDIGIGILPNFVAQKNPEIEALSIVNSEKTPLWFVIHPEVQKNKKIIIFSDFLISILKGKI